MSLIDGLVSYWKADTNGSFPDAHGSNDGTIQGAIYTASGKINGGYDFDGINDYITVGNAITSAISGDITVACWVNLDANNSAQYIISGRDSDSGNYGWVLVKEDSGDGNVAGFLIDTPNGVSYVVGTTDLSGTGWHYIVGVRDSSSSVKIYVDGVDESTTTPSSTGDMSSDVILHIGRSSLSAALYTAGIIDEIGIWNVAKTSTEITSLYNSGAGNAYPFSDVPVATDNAIFFGAGL